MFLFLVPIEMPRHTRSRRKHRGGVQGPGLTVPTDTTHAVALFAVTEENLVNFQRLIASPRDCVINALQIIGFLDSNAANLMRITSLGRVGGFTSDEIERIFILYTKHNHDFIETSNSTDFERAIQEQVPVGHACFIGLQNATASHVALIARRANGDLMLIDPQQEIYINVLDPRISGYFEEYTTYHLLFRCLDPLTDPQLRGLGFVF